MATYLIALLICIAGRCADHQSTLDDVQLPAAVDRADSYRAFNRAGVTLRARELGDRGEDNPAQILWIQGGPYRLRIAIDTSATRTAHPTLVVALHGDLGGREQDEFAAHVAASSRDVIAAGLLRPGYTDSLGNTSDGDKGLTTGDNYNVTNTNAIAAGIVELKRRFHPRRTILVGHSGGAAIVANILGRHPDLADAALLVSCPCDVALWRQHMLERTHFRGFRGQIETLSPIDLVSDIRANVPVIMVVGTQDDVAPPGISERYQTAAVQAGKNVRLVQVKGKPHDMFLDPEVFAQLARLF